MKRVVILVLTSCSLQFTCCNLVRNNEVPKRGINNSITQVDSGAGLLSYNHYLYLNSLSNGDTWYDETGNQDFFYRLLLSSVGEEAYLDVELVEILEEGNLKLISRNVVQCDLFDLEYYPLNMNILFWETPKKAKIKIRDNLYLLDLDSMKTTMEE